MKSQILKIAGVKSEKEFYKKYPTEAAFFKAHPEAKKSIKKAQTGSNIDVNNNGIPDYLENINPNVGNIIQSQMQSPGVNAGMYNSTPYPTPDYNKMYMSMSKADENLTPPIDYNKEYMNMSTADEQLKQPKANSNSSKGFNFGGASNVVGGFMEGMQQIEEEKKLRKQTEAWAGASNVVKDAAISNAYAPKPIRKWFRPDDSRFVHNTSEQYLQQGRGTDVLGQNGSMIGGNPTEITNNYGVGSNVYKDLQDPNDVKAYQSGGGFGQWWGQTNSQMSGSGDTSFMGNLGQGSPFDSFVGSSFGNSGGYKAGSSIGSAFGPIGSFVGGIAGGFLDDEPSKTAAAQAKIKFNNEYISGLNYGNQIHNTFSRNTQNGGYMNPEYNPQVIAKFGELNAQDFADFAHKDQYRAGGHLKEYTPPSERAMETYENGGEISSYALGGKLKSYWGGKVEDMSHNPYLPGSGMTAMIKGASHNDGGVGISYGEGGYQGMAANGADMGADIEAEDNEPVIEIAENGTKDTKAVVYGNIPASGIMADAFGNETVNRLVDKYPGWTMKNIVAERTKDEIKANKNIEKAASISNKADTNNKFGKLEEGTAKIIEDAGNTSLQMIADEKIALADFQDYLQNIKQHLSYARGKNVSAEAVGRGTIKGKPITMKDVLDGKIDDRDPITKDAPIENPYAKYGTFLNKAQSGIGWKNALDSEDDNYNNNEVVAAQESDVIPINSNQTAAPNINIVDEGNPEVSGSGSEGNITEEQYNDFVKMYNESQSTKGKKNKNTLDFQRAYHKSFPQEALAAIQKTTRENGLSNKAKEMGLTKEDILEGKDVAKILQSNEDEYHGPRTDQYMASVRSHFQKTPPAQDIHLNTLGGNVNTTTGTNTTKSQIEVVPYKGNNVADVFNMFSSLFQKDNIPGIDPRQFAGEYMAIAQNQYEPVPSQSMQYELDPLYRVSYQDVRNASTADFRDALRQGAFNPAVAAGVFGKKAIADQTSYADEFRTNQALEQQIFGGNRAKINQERAANIQLNANQMDKQNIAMSKTKETQQKAVASMADKAMKYDTDVLKYKLQRNLFPNFGFGANGRTYTQGPFYKPVIPQIYGEKGTIEEVPVKDANGNILYYKMLETGKSQTPPLATPPFIPGQGYNAKNGKSIVKNAKNSSVVKSYKNL